MNTLGEVSVKESVDAEEKTFTLLKNEANGVDEKLRKGPPVHPPKVLSPQRQWYLYDMIRPHIPDEKDKESTAPRPKVPKSNPKKE
jgi:hypothetical protein